MKDEFSSLREEGKKAEEGDKKTSSRSSVSVSKVSDFLGQDHKKECKFSVTSS
ncbi:MAG: hypothetical protein KBB94_08340 [Legionellaceae bacterium]|nr:hypothetical protein [Legionellaceae bacterium]MBP9775420.1 hypothetical protein [Legionellaceae bacterium]